METDSKFYTYREVVDYVKNNGNKPKQIEKDNPAWKTLHLVDPAMKGQVMKDLGYTPKPAMGIAKRFAMGESFKENFNKLIMLESFSDTIYYHGGSWDGKSPIKTTGRGALGTGAYFSPDFNFAKEYANDANGVVTPVKLNIHNPLIIERNSSKHIHPCVEALTKLGMDREKAFNLVEKVEEQKGYMGKEIASRAIKQGYDSIIQIVDGKLHEVVIWDSSKVIPQNK